MNILVTGCAGFIGSHLCERLLRDGHTICGVDNFDNYYDLAIKESHIAALQQHDNFSLYRVDIRDTEAMAEPWERCRPDRVVHLAARAGVRPSIQQPALYSDVNVTGTTRIFELAQATSTPVVFASSSSVYGGSTRIPYREDDPVDRPISPYAATKRACELLAATYNHLYQLPLVALRFFTVYGPRQRPDMAIYKFAHAILEGRTVTLYGDGTTARDYTYIDDIVDGIVASVERAPQLGFEIFNLGNSRTVELRRLIEVIEDAAGKKANIEWQPVQPGDVTLTYADVSHAHELLGYSPQTPIEEGVRRYVQWLKSNGQSK
jgi:UDP-glucuronate 4-epimerase